MGKFEIVGDGCANDGEEVMRLARVFQERLGEAVITPPPPPGMEVAGVFRDFPVDLATLNTAGAAGIPFREKGVKLIFRKMGSNPGARIDFVAAGRITQLYPGCVVDAPFDGGTLVIGDGSSSVGTALFTIVKLEGYNLIEPINVNAPQSSNNFILGSSASGTITYVTVNEDTDPSGAQPTGSFKANGYTSIILLIDGLSAAANATSFDLVPWFDPSRNGSWHEQGTERISVPDSDTSGARFRVVAIRIQNAVGDMYFAVRNLLAAARTSLGMAVIGVY